MQWTSAVCHLEGVDLILGRGWTQQENIHISIKKKNPPKQNTLASVDLLLLSHVGQSSHRLFLAMLAVWLGSKDTYAGQWFHHFAAIEIAS